jgi:phosphoribosyl 1,2-cyclic phosphate phosphodiesterase
MESGESRRIGRYTVRALPANHATADKAVHFLITDREKTLFYGLDGAWLTYAEVGAIRESAPDLAILDATIGDVPGDRRVFEHNNLNMVIEMKKSIGKDIKKYVISHMAYTLHTDHDTLSKEMEKHDIITAYDGMEIEF